MKILWPYEVTNRNVMTSVPGIIRQGRWQGYWEITEAKKRTFIPTGGLGDLLFEEFTGPSLQCSQIPQRRNKRQRVNFKSLLLVKN